MNHTTININFTVQVSLLLQLWRKNLLIPMLNAGLWFTPVPSVVREKKHRLMMLLAPSSKKIRITGLIIIGLCDIKKNNRHRCLQPIRHLSFRDRSDLNTKLFRSGLVESTCRVHMHSESGDWLLKVYEILSVKIKQ